MFIEKCRIFLLVTICLLVTSCSNVKYVTKQDVKYLKSTGFSDDYHNNKTKQFGALLFESSKNNSDAVGRAFIIRKDKSAYIAETMLTDNGDSKKSAFEKSYFSIGADKKNSIFGIKLRFVY